MIQFLRERIRRMYLLNAINYYCNHLKIYSLLFIENDRIMARIF